MGLSFPLLFLLSLGFYQHKKKLRGEFLSNGFFLFLQLRTWVSCFRYGFYFCPVPTWNEHPGNGKILSFFSKIGFFNDFQSSIKREMYETETPPNSCFYQFFQGMETLPYSFFIFFLVYVSKRFSTN